MCASMCTNYIKRLLHLQQMLQHQEAAQDDLVDINGAIMLKNRRSAHESTDVMFINISYSNI